MGKGVKKSSPSIMKEMVPFIGLMFMLLSFRSAVADWNQVPTGSMKPTILEGDRIWVNKLAYDLKVPFTDVRVARWEEPSPGEIVVFFSPRDEMRMVKRLVAGPGDRVMLDDNRLFINGEEAVYQPIDIDELAVDIEELAANQSIQVESSSAVPSHPVMFLPYRSPYRNFSSVQVPDDHYFAMGDNRNNSIDSREFGFIHRDLIVGQATNVLVSWKPGVPWRQRWERFGAPLP